MQVSRDVKEVIGTIMRVLDGGRLSRAEVEDLVFEASGELQVALNEAVLELLAFAFDCESGAAAPDAEMTASLQRSLAKIVNAADAERVAFKRAADSTAEARSQR